MKITTSSISNISTGLTTAREKHDENKNNAAPKTQEKTGMLTEAQHTLRQMPEVDNARVAEMKTAIANGDIPLDTDALARAMMDFYRR